MRAEQDAVDAVLRGPESADDVGVGVQTAISLFSTEMLRALAQSQKTARG